VACFSKTVSMRDKERLHDYRFMPEPNLPPLRLYTMETVRAGVPPEQVINVDELRDRMPEMPSAQRSRLCRTYGLSVEHSNTLVVSCDQSLLLCSHPSSPCYSACLFFYELNTLNSNRITQGRNENMLSSSERLSAFLELNIEEIFEFYT